MFPRFTNWLCSGTSNHSQDFSRMEMLADDEGLGGKVGVSFRWLILVLMFLIYYFCFNLIVFEIIIS